MAAKPGNTGVTRLIKAFFYSVDGLKAAFRDEAAFRQELVLLVILVPIACIIDVSAAERALLVASLFLVLIVEIVNSAIEAAIERVSSDIHPLSKKAKDLGSAAVFLALCNAGCLWAIILLQ